MTLARLLLVNALFTLVGGFILFFVPHQIMSLVGVHTEPGTDFVYYLLGASALSLAVLSYGARTLTDARSLRVVALTCLAFHALSAGVGVYAFAHGLSAAVWVNTLIHIIFAVLFVYYGFVIKIKGA